MCSPQRPRSPQTRLLRQRLSLACRWRRLLPSLPTCTCMRDIWGISIHENDYGDFGQTWKLRMRTSPKKKAKDTKRNKYNRKGNPRRTTKTLERWQTRDILKKTEEALNQTSTSISLSFAPTPLSLSLFLLPFRLSTFLLSLHLPLQTPTFTTIHPILSLSLTQFLPLLPFRRFQVRHRARLAAVPRSKLFRVEARVFALIYIYIYV